MQNKTTQDDEQRRQRFKILVAQGSTTFQSVELEDPVPLGRQILAACGLRPEGDYTLFNILQAGDFEDVRLDEPVDLRRPGAERFIAFKSDRDFKLTLNGSQIVWGLPKISGTDLYALAKASQDEAVFLVVRGGEDVQIEPEDEVDLTAPGIEHFEVAPQRHTKIVIIVNGREKEVPTRHITFEQLVALAYPGEPPQPNITYDVTYRKVASFPHQGELAAGGSVEVKKDGSIFNVGRTIQS
ncbi:multiubiquitin domain-containing protein [Cupriavidus sp. 2SB]|uniref:multiubiquitin domain-containing protein n=1 Tax=Cupriavidus sp. 2SB TaxID=2502199 RepID=UPI0010F9A876|nr:multiubiquitin domain-containing protein [Cupriavidus sp. 2SB]